jgi:hypothetical protein
MHVRCGHSKTRLSEDVRLATAEERNTNHEESCVPPGAAIQEDDSFFHRNVGGWIAGTRMARVPQVNIRVQSTSEAIESQLNWRMRSTTVCSAQCQKKLN